METPSAPPLGAEVLCIHASIELKGEESFCAW